MEQIFNTIEYLAIVMSFLLIITFSYKQVRLYQQSHYHISSFKKIIKNFYINKRSYLLVPLIFFSLYLQFWYIQLALSFYLGFLILIQYKERVKLRLKITARIRRLYIAIVFVMTVFGSLVSLIIPLKQLMAALVAVAIFSPFLIFLSALITWPLEVLISLYYQKLAIRKLNKYQTIRIGITGSYGKTSTKNVLQAYLQNYFMSVSTRQSFNTQNGVSRCINEDLQAYHEILIVEMGATHKNDISKLVKLTKPKYGIITAIGPQHLESFKSVENILLEKIKLVESLPADGLAVINFDNQYLKNHPLKTNCRIITFGLDEGANYQAFDLKLSLKGLKFKIKHNEQVVSLETKLLGRHQVYNILAAYALAKELGISEEELINQTALLESVEHRLEIRKEKSLTIINDGFNSNIEGFMNALEILSLHQKYRIIITPGLVEGGNREEEMNLSLCKRISEVCDLVILVKTKGSLVIKQGLDDLGFTNVIFVENFKKGMELVRIDYPKAVVLIENDISDIYTI